VTLTKLIPPGAADVFRRGTVVFPNPVAVACGGVLRASSPEALVDLLVKAGEVLARYCSCLAVASYAARADESQRLVFPALDGPLAFGDFLSLVQAVADADFDHPLRSYLVPLRAKASGKRAEPGASQIALTRLLELRNRLGHSLSGLNSARARSILEKDVPIENLRVALSGLENLLGLPLFVIEEQKVARKRCVARRLVLMGDSSDPEPEQVELSGPLEQDGDPYLGLREGTLPLAPMLVWRLAPSSSNTRLFLLDAVRADALGYKAIEPAPEESSAEEAAIFRARIAGVRCQLEAVGLVDGRSFEREWTERRRTLEEARLRTRMVIPWDEFDEASLRWFARQLGSGDAEPRALIGERLLDERDALLDREVEQLRLLFGKPEVVHRLLGREMVDLRERERPDSRWTERSELHTNVIDSLRSAVDFFGRHLRLGTVGLDDLKATAGSPDYIAMREALVNLFIHQDYGVSSAAAQVELEPSRAVFFNPGFSLVGREGLLSGGRSQARNPLIGRALRLVGFAELAGSGLREVQRCWRAAKRRPPRMDSDRAGNSFTLTLDWRTIPEAYDAFWQTKLGVSLSSPEATILNLSVEPGGIGLDEAVSATGISIDETRGAIANLIRQSLISEKSQRYYIKDHLRDIQSPKSRPKEGRKPGGDT
jgi:hypothetical protein